MKESLDYIYKEQKELSTLGGVGALLGWDQMTYMPKLGAVARSEQSSIISRLYHEKIVSDGLWKHVKNLLKSNVYDGLSEKDKYVVKRLEKDLEKARKVPSDFVERMAKVTTLAYQAWEAARQKNSYPVFSPHLEKIVKMEKEYCDYIALPGSKYNSLLDDYEEGMTVDKLREEFKFLKSELVKMLEKIKSSQVFNDQQDLNIKFDSETQRKICEMIFEKLNFRPNG